MTLDELDRIRADNFRILALYSQYLNRCPRAITPSAVREITGSLSSLSAEEAARAEESAVYGLLSALLTPSDPALARAYILPAVKRLSVSEYKKDPYYKRVRPPAVKRGRWELGYQSYAPYEIFVRDDMTYEWNGRELPAIGFFDESFRFPAILQDGREWMTVTPNEIATMRAPIAAAHGRVVTYGLGLGYFAFMACEREAVESVTVVERDPEVIALFRECLFPYFKNKQKLRILQADALAFAESETKHYDFCFADIWHDAADGLPLYLRLKEKEPYAPHTTFYYWIEKTLHSYLRTHRLAMLRKEGECSADRLLAAGGSEALARVAREGVFSHIT